MPMTEESIRQLESEAEILESQAKEFAQLASYLYGESEHKVRLVTLSEDAVKKAGEIRHQIKLLKEHGPN